MDFGEKPLYKEITRSLARDIQSGKLKPDTRLPTHRDLAVKLGVALGTVTRAYTDAEQRGLIRGEGRRGTFVGRPAISSSALSRLRVTQPGLLDLSINFPIFDTDPSLSEVLREIARDRKNQYLLHYSEPEGFIGHREAGAAWLKSLGHEALADDLIITSGAQHAIHTVLSALCRTGDTILAEDLTYPGTRSAADLLELNVIGIEADKYGVIPDALEKTCQKTNARLFYCIPTLQNPTNAIMPLERRRAVVDIARKYDLIIVEDEIHRPLVSQPPPTIASLAPERTVLIVSASKVVAAGLRVAFAAIPESMRRSVVETLQVSVYCVPFLTVEIFSRWLENGTVEATIDRKKQEAMLRQEMAREILGDERLRTYNYSYFAWMPLPSGWKVNEFVMEAASRGVAVSPSELFWCGQGEPPEAIRICLGAVDDRAMLQIALEKLADILRTGRLRQRATM